MAKKKTGDKKPNIKEKDVALPVETTEEESAKAAPDPETSEIKDKISTEDALRQENRSLRKEVKSFKQVAQTNERLTSEIASLTETVRTLKGSNRELSAKCNRMKNILMLGNCSTLSLLIDEFIGFTTPMIQQIVLEAHLAEFDKEVREKILTIIKFLTETAGEFQTILEIPTFSIETSSSKKQLKTKGTKIRQSIERLDAISDSLDDSQIKLICTQFNEIQQFLDSFEMGGEAQ